MINKTIALIAGLIACATSTLAADFIEMKSPGHTRSGVPDIDNIRIPLKSGIAYHSETLELPNPKGGAGSGYYYGYQLQANSSKNGIEVSLLVNIFEGFTDLGSKDVGEKLSPVSTIFKNKFLLEKPGMQWTKVTVAKDTTYEVRWITE